MTDEAALIELDRPVPRAGAGTTPPVRRHRDVGLLLATLLVLALGGAAPTGSVLWHRLPVIPLGDRSDADYQIVGDRLYTIAGEGHRHVTTAWSLDPVRRLWSVTLTPPEPAPSPGLVLMPGPGSLRESGGVLLVSFDPYTLVLDRDTGAVRWRSAVPVDPVPGGRLGVVQEQVYRPGSVYDTSSGDPGMLYFSPSGVAHREPPERTVLTGVDLATGRRLWRTAEPGSVGVSQPDAAPGSVLVLTATRLVLRDAATGAVLRRRELDELRGAAGLSSDIVGDVLRVYSGAYGDGGRVTGYDTATLRRLWQRPDIPVPGSAANCSGVLCANDGPGPAVLNPATGTVRWRPNGGRSLLALDPDTLLEAGESNVRPLRTVDADTGRTRTDLHAWDAYLDVPEPGPLIVTRNVRSHGTVFGAVLPGAVAVQPLGYADARMVACRAGTRHIACLSPAGIQVWSYRV
ncbi:outer membrane protein assembly factor BamB family protein [Mangrovihabitans endophyticus]|nr:PQQ-binding-like beta-propeller repeat protein [Mangrovihabitans endophyticus]